MLPRRCAWPTHPRQLTDRLELTTPSSMAATDLVRQLRGLTGTGCRPTHALLAMGGQQLGRRSNCVVYLRRREAPRSEG